MDLVHVNDSLEISEGPRSQFGFTVAEGDHNEKESTF